VKLGILGGTFDPVHFGHLRIAEEARVAFNLDRVLFIPCHIPPHKNHKQAAAPKLRLEMLNLAVKGNPFFEISDIELNRKGKSYLIDTLADLMDLYGPATDLFFIMGADSFFEIGTWREYQKLFYLTNFIVVTRPDFAGELSEQLVLSSLPVDIGKNFCYDSKSCSIKHISGRKTYLLKTTPFAISSTDLRQKVRGGKSIRYLLPFEVEKFIKETGLYKTRI